MPSVLAVEKPRILIVDDHPENLIAIHAVLDSPDYIIKDCSSGNEALREIYDGIYDLILMDVQMPDMDGFQTAQIIKSLPKSELTPLIFISANYLDEASALKGYEVGAIDYITKPFPPETLRKKVEFFVKYAPRIRDEQRHKDTESLYEKFEAIFNELVNPLWFIQLNIQLFKKISDTDKGKVLEALNRKLVSLDQATHRMRDLILRYRHQLEDELNH